MKDSQFPDTELGNALKSMVHSADQIYREYITQDYKYDQVCRIPKKVAHLWLRQSAAFKVGLLNYYMIGGSADDPSRPIQWTNKGAIRVDDGSESHNETWLYLHDFSYWVVRPRRKR